MGMDLSLIHIYHDHLICTNCGKIVEEKILDNEKLAKSLKDKYNFELDYYSLRIYGIRCV